MRRYRFLQLDVFTGHPFGGNQLAVFTAPDDLSDVEMQDIAREMNFSETTFVLPASDPRALRRVRIFTPATELPMAGHPVIGTTFALASDGVIRVSDVSPIRLQLGVGTVAIDLLFEADTLCFAWMHQPLPAFSAWTGDRAILAAALCLDEADLATALPIESGSSGVPFLYVPLASREALGRARAGAGLPDLLAEVGESAGAYLFAWEPALSGPVAAWSRMFAPAMGIVEDAATGSAAGPFGVYLVRHGLARPDADGDAHARIEQGVEMGRPSRLSVTVTMGAGTVQDVRVGGEAVVVAEGELFLPDR